MDYVTLIVIGLIIKCEAGDERDNPHIIFSSLSSSKQQHAINYTVVANKTLHLHFQNMSRGWCYNYYVHEAKLDKGEPPTIKNSTISYSTITHSMSALWKCRVLENKNSDYNKKLIKHFEEKYHIFLLNLHVKGAKSVQMTVNGKELTFGEADLSSPYDGHTIYFYEDGEHVQIDCRNPHSTGSVHLEYFTKDAAKISDSETFTIQLHSGSNSYIDCVYNSTDPTDTYVYRVTFVMKKRLFYFNDSNIRSDMHISANQDKGSKFSSPILGSSIGAVLIILGLTGVACWYVYRRKNKRIKTPYVDLSNHYDSPTPQCTNECENQYDQCHYNENLSNRDTYYAIPESVENNMDPEDHYYTKVDYLKCKPKIGEIQTRDSKVYDEPYVSIATRDGLQASQQI